MIPNKPMCRETRKLLEDLEIIAEGSGVTTLVSSKDIYYAEQLMLRYYESPVINMLKSRLRVIKNKSSKHFSPDYWMKIVQTGFQNNTSVMRESGTWNGGICGDDFALNQFILLTSYLVTDYSLIDANTIMVMAHKYNVDTIKNGIKIAKDNNVYNINYVKAVIERQEALTNIKKQDIEKLGKKADSATQILGEQKVNNSIADLATASYNWQKALENAELERQLKEAGML